MPRLEPGGGWISGAPYMNPLPSASPTNQADESAVVAEAVQALNEFAIDLDRATARKLLALWRHYEDLSPKDAVDVLKRYPGKGDK